MAARVAILNRQFFSADKTGRAAATGFHRDHRNTRPTRSNKGTSEEKSTSVRSGGADKGTGGNGGSGIHDRTQHVKRCSPRNGGLSIEVPSPKPPRFANNAHFAVAQL